MAVIESETTLYIIDGVVYIGDKLAVPTDVPERTDLPDDHPLKDRRVLSNVISGMPDCEIGTDGSVVCIDPDGDIK